MVEGTGNRQGSEKYGNILFYTLLALLSILLIYKYQPFPPDDFLRHVRYLDYQPLGGYGYMFPQSLFERIHFDPWYGFDLMSGKAASLFGLERTVFLFEVFFCLLYGAALLVGTGHPKPVPLVIMIVLFFCSYGLERVFLIRPAILMGILLLFGVRARGIYAGLAGAFVSAFLYYLFWVYTIPLAIAHYFRGDRRFAYALCSGTIISLGLWMALTGGEYLSVIAGLFRSLLGGREGVSIVENKPFFHALTSPVVFMTAMAFLLSLYRDRKTDIHLFLIILTAPAAIQIRYFTDITLPLMLLYAVNQNLQHLNEIYRKYMPAFAITCFVPFALLVAPASTYTSHGGKFPSLRGLSIPMGASVFAETMPLNFQAIFHNREPLRVTPSAEIGWNDRETRRAIQDIMEKRQLDTSVCGYLRAGGTDYVLSSREVTAACLEPLQTFRQRGSIRDVTLYRVLPENKEKQETSGQ